MADKKPDVEMKDPNHAKASELKLSPPKPFTGKREELDDFIQEVNLYLDINDEMYYTDKKKIRYLLSFMNSGDAKSWKSQFLRSVTTNERTNLGTWDAFIKKLKEAFKPYDTPGDAVEELLVLQMGNSSIEDHLAQFKVLLEIRSTERFTFSNRLLSKIVELSPPERPPSTPHSTQKS